MMTKLYIGIDLGATNVRAGAFTADGELLASQAAEIEAARGPQAGLERIGDLVADVLRVANASSGPERPSPEGRRLAGIGVGSTGPTDSERGLIVNPGTMPGWVDVPIVDYLSQRFGVPARLENDADAAALGEYWQGAAVGVSRLYMVTVGTGIGTAFVQDGAVYRGAGGFHPEAGHMIVDPAGPECYCGGRGCWESWSSGTAIARAAREVLGIWAQRAQEADAQALLDTPLMQLTDARPERVTAELVAEAARRHDPVAQSVITAAADRFGLGIFNLIMAFYPEMIVLGGGVMRSLDLFMPAIQRAAARAGAMAPVDNLRIAPAQLGDEAGMYGAAYAIRKRLGNSLRG